MGKAISKKHTTTEKTPSDAKFGDFSSLPDTQLRHRCWREDGMRLVHEIERHLAGSGFSPNPAHVVVYLRTMTRDEMLESINRHKRKEEV